MVDFGVPEKIVLALAEAQDCSVFVEAGTYEGKTARWAAQHFSQVYTIENSPELYERYAAALCALPSVQALYGDSRDRLPTVLLEIGQKRAIHWLDSHWFGGETGGGEHDQCPLLEELIILGDREQDIILIDDARLFLAAPPMPHRPERWPSILDVMAVLLAKGRRPFVQVVDDVIFVVPDEPKLREILTRYAKRRNNLFWQSYANWKHQKG